MGNEPRKCLKGGDPDQEVKLAAPPVVGDASMDAEDRVRLVTRKSAFGHCWVRF